MSLMLPALTEEGFAGNPRNLASSVENHQHERGGVLSPRRHDEPDGGIPHFGRKKRRMLSVVIATIGRRTLEHAIESVLTQGLTCLVVNDGVEMSEPPPRPGLKYLKLGQNFGRLDGKLWYGQVAFTAGVWLSETEFTMGIGDDDELLPDVVPRMCERMRSSPDIDIWIPGIQFNTGRVLCDKPGRLRCGNVSHTIYRSKILATDPMFNRRGDNTAVHDWLHVERCVREGWTIDWFGFPCVSIRSRLPGTNGRGERGEV